MLEIGRTAKGTTPIAVSAIGTVPDSEAESGEGAKNLCGFAFFASSRFY